MKKYLLSQKTIFVVFCLLTIFISRQSLFGNISSKNKIEISSDYVITDSVCLPVLNFHGYIHHWGHKIILNWEDPVNLRKDILYTEGFESTASGSIPNGWEVIDLDGDGHSWECLYNETFIQGYNGSRGLLSSVSSSRGVIGNVSSDNYVIIPNLEGSLSLSYYVRAEEKISPNEHYCVLVSTTGNSQEDFSVIFEETLHTDMISYRNIDSSKYSMPWNYRHLSLPEGTKYIAFRHYDNPESSYRLNLDDISFCSTPVYDISYNLYRNGELIATTVNTFYEDKDIEYGTQHYSIEVNYGDCISELNSISVDYEPVSDCPIPEDLHFIIYPDKIFILWDMNPPSWSNGFKVYRDGVLLGSNSYPAWVDYDVPGMGVYEYCVINDNGLCSSDIVCLNVVFPDTNSFLSPVNLVASNDGDNNITLTWDSPASKGVRSDSSVIILNEESDYEVTPYQLVPKRWSQLDADGDNHTWTLQSGLLGYKSRYCLASSSYIDSIGSLTPDNYLISPLLYSAGRLEYKVSAHDTRFSEEHYAVLASQSGTELKDFTVVFEETLSSEMSYPNLQGLWLDRSVELPSGTRYIAFRHYGCSNQYWLKLDNIKVFSGDVFPVGEITGYNIYLNNNLIGTIDDPTVTTFVDDFSFNKESAEYCVRTLYEGGISSATCATVGLTSIEDSDYSIYPNPADKIVNVSGKEVEVIYIYNNIGQLVAQVVGNQVDVSDYVPGLYLFHIISLDGIVSKVKVAVSR